MNTPQNIQSGAAMLKDSYRSSRGKKKPQLEAILNRIGKKGC